MILLYIIALLITMCAVFGGAVAINMLFNIDLIVSAMISAGFMVAVMFVAIVVIATIEGDYEEDDDGRD